MMYYLISLCFLLTGMRIIHPYFENLTDIIKETVIISSIKKIIIKTWAMPPPFVTLIAIAAKSDITPENPNVKYDDLEIAEIIRINPKTINMITAGSISFISFKKLFTRSIIN